MQIKKNDIFDNKDIKIFKKYQNFTYNIYKYIYNKIIFTYSLL